MHAKNIFERYASGERNFRGIFLPRENLSAFSFFDGEIYKADFRNADFYGAQLHGICFEGANLSGAKFSGANLRDSNFIGANLQNVEFCGSDLSGADLTDANIIGANFHSCSLSSKTKLPNLAMMFCASWHYLQPELIELIDHLNSGISLEYVLDIEECGVWAPSIQKTIEAIIKKCCWVD